MWIDRLLASRARTALEYSAKFAEERQKVLAENAANIDVPDYHAKRVDVGQFQRTIKAAIGESARAGTEALPLRGNAQLSTDARGALRVRPQREPAENALFHDGTNARLETLASDAQQNALSYQVAMNLLKGKFDSLLTAIRGRL